MSLHRLLSACLLGALAPLVSAASPYNPWLADSAWPQMHQGPWQQGSATAPGPTSASQLGDPQFVATGLVNIGLLQSPIYPNGQRVFWGGTIDQVYKLAVTDGKLRKVASTSRYATALSNVRTPFAGAYTALRFDNTYLTGSGRTVLAYRDANPGDMNSSITLYKRFEIPASVAPDPASGTPDHITGMNLLFDGKIAVATRYGAVGVIDIESGVGKFVRVADGQKISNSIAVARDGGIYVVSNREMYRFQWNGGGTWASSSLDSPLDGNCATCWRQAYHVDPPAPGMLGDGSGSTPSLMGPNGEYVVITDGARVTNLTVYRTGVLTGGQPRKVAAIPVDFGQGASRAQTASEQSVLVSGYGMAVVSNDYRSVETIGNDLPWWLKPLLDPLLAMPVMQNIDAARVTLTAYTPKHQPLGVQKFSFDPAAGALRSDWSRLDISCPNSVPSMSETSGRFYCVGAKDLSWTIESVEWLTGQNHFRKYIGLLPRYNSFYAPTELDGNGGMIYGSVDGVVYLPKR